MVVFMNIRIVPLFVLDSWVAAHRVKKSCKFYYRGGIFNIEQVQEELAKRREDDN
jgi:hypothetical protein